MSFKLSELLDDAKRLQMKNVLERLQAQEQSGEIDGQVIRQCLLEIKPIQELGKRNSAKDEAVLQQIIKLAQSLLVMATKEPEKVAPEVVAPKVPAKQTVLKEIKIPDFVSLSNLTEATITQSGEVVEAVLIEEGWSKNGRYYSKNVIESLPALIGNSRKVYLNHLMSKTQQEQGRDMSRWAAQIDEAWVAPSAVTPGKVAFVGKIHVFDRPDGWLKERVLKYPQEVGLSISAFAKTKEGEAEGRKGMIVEEVTKLESFDFVDRPAAGGRVMRIAAGMDFDEFADDASTIETVQVPQDIMEALKDKLASLKAKVALDKKKSEFWDLKYALQDSLRDIANLPDVKDDAKVTMMGQVIDEFKGLVLEMPLVAMFKTTEATKAVTSNKEGQNEVEFKDLTVTVLATERPDLIQALKEGFEADLAASAETKQKEETLKTLEAENKRLSEEIEAGKRDKLVQERTKLVGEKLTAAELPEWLADDTFRKELVECKDEAEIDAKIARQKTILEKAKDTKPGVKGNGPAANQPPVVVKEENKDDEKKVDGKSIIESAFRQ